MLKLFSHLKKNKGTKHQQSTATVSALFTVRTFFCVNSVDTFWMFAKSTPLYRHRVHVYTETTSADTAQCALHRMNFCLDYCIFFCCCCRWCIVIVSHNRSFSYGWAGFFNKYEYASTCRHTHIRHMRSIFINVLFAFSECEKWIFTVCIRRNDHRSRAKNIITSNLDFNFIYTRAYEKQ